MPVCNHNLEPGQSKDNFEWVGRRDKGDNFKVYERKLSFLHFEPPVLLITPEQQTDLKPENRQGRIIFVERAHWRKEVKDEVEDTFSCGDLIFIYSTLFCRGGDIEGGFYV